MKLDWQTTCEVKALILDILNETSQISDLEDYWHGLSRPDYPVKELRRLDINLFDGAMYGNEPGIKAVVYCVDDDLNIDYGGGIRMNVPDLPDHLKEVKQ